jgi:integrase
VHELEFERAMRAASPPAQLAMLLAHEAGLRAGSISRITRQNCDFERRWLRGRTKGGANYSVPMTARLYERLLFACAGAEPTEPLLHAVSYRHQASTVQELAYHIRQTKRRAGIETEWTLHDLRRSAARRVYDRTRDVRKVQRLLSHKNLSTTMWYLGDAGTDIDAADLETQPTTIQQRKDGTNP